MKNESIFYKPTLLLIDLLTHSLIVFFEPHDGLEPSTYALRMRCSTN